MKRKSMLYYGIGYLICAIALLLFGKFGPDVTFKELIVGFAIGLILPSIILICKYIYWTKPPNVQIYEARIKEEQINLKDERKIMLREKSGRITYIIMFVVLTALNIVFTFIGVEKWIIFTLWGVIAFKYICGVAVFYYLAEKM